MKQIRTFFDAAYAAPEVSFLARLGVSARHLTETGLVELVSPPPFERARLDGLHDPEYLRAFDGGIAPLAASVGVPWSPALRDAFYAMLSGQLAAVSHALAHRIAMNLACGFHHAVRERGSGFCALNGLALVAHAMPQLRVFVIDCDEHGGNGTEEFAARLPNLYQASIFGTRFGCFGGTRSWALPVAGGDIDGYRRALDEVEALVRNHRPDVVLYQAGADCHEDDPKARVRLSDDAMRERDRRVFEIARDVGAATVFVVAGGYQAPRAVARLNANTVRAAHAVFMGAPPS